MPMWDLEVLLRPLRALQVADNEDILVDNEAAWRFGPIGAFWKLLISIAPLTLNFQKCDYGFF